MVDHENTNELLDQEVLDYVQDNAEDEGTIFNKVGGKLDLTQAPTLYNTDDPNLRAKAVGSEMISRANSVTAPLVKVTKGGKKVALLELQLGSNIPFIQMPKATVDTIAHGNINVNTEKYKDYKFEFTYITPKSDDHTYNSVIDSIIDDNKTKYGTDRLKYCFTVESKLATCSLSFFLDCITKNIVMIQGLELFLGDDIVLSEVYGDSLYVQKVNTMLIGMLDDPNETYTSPGALYTNSFNRDKTYIQNNNKISVDRLYEALVTNNKKLSAKYLSLPSSCMYNGKDGTYPLAIQDLDGCQMVRSNTPPLLLINLGTGAELSPDDPNPEIPNNIILQMNQLNNYYYLSNGVACKPESNFCILVPVY